MEKKSKLLNLASLGIGAVNGLLGAGGGMLAVPLLKKSGLSQKEAHANAVAVILPLSALSGALYLIKDYVNLSDSFSYIPSGMIGALIGTYILKKIKPLLLKKVFAVFMIYAGIRLLIR